MRLKINTKKESRVDNTWLALVSLLLAILLSSLGTSVVNVALPTLADVFNVSFQETQWVVIAYLLAITALVVTVGRLGDLVGHYRVLRFGILLFTTTSVLGGFATNFWLLVVMRFIQGVGAAILMALAMALVSDVVSQDRIGSAMGLLGTMSAIGTAFGPPLGGVLIETLSWRFIFWFNLPLGVLAFLLAHFCLPTDKRETNAHPNVIDYWGTLLLTFALIAYTLSMTVGQGNFGIFNLSLLIIAFFLLGLFILAEKNSQSPLIQLEMFNDLFFSMNLAMNSLVTSVLMTTLVVGPFYLSIALELNAAQTGLAMAVGPSVSALTGVVAGRLVDRFGSHMITLIGLLGVFVGSMMLSLLPISVGVFGYLVSLAMMTMGYASFLAAVSTTLMKGVLPRQRGMVSGMYNLSRNLGLLTGASVMGAIFAFATKTNNVTEASPIMVAYGMRMTFAISALLIVFAIGLGVKGRIFTSE